MKECRLSFNEFWKILTHTLKEKQVVKNWTVYHGYIPNGDFSASYEGGSLIDCWIPLAKNPQRVPKKDFQFIYDNWGVYIDGTLKRHELAANSHFTKYTISILHQYENLCRKKPLRWHICNILRHLWRTHLE